MKLLNARKLKTECIDDSNFKLLLEKEVNMCDSDNNTALIFYASKIRIYWIMTYLQQCSRNNSAY